MADTYYTRLTIVHPNDVNKLDPRLGIVIAETATTGKFIMTDITWESVINSNAVTTIAMQQKGEIKIYEPIGMAMLDYIKLSAFQLGITNHLTAEFLLEMEIIAENLPKDSTPFKYIWPILLISTDVKATVTEKGTEYNIAFLHTSNQSQTDAVQPIKETSKIEAGNVGEYFRKLQIDLETKEFNYAAARQKAGSGQIKYGANPAAQDDFHDEYHFLVEPRIEKYEFTTKGRADPAVQGTWLGAGSFFGRFNISIRPGTTITQQISRILKSTKDISDVQQNRPKPATADAHGSSEENKKNIESMIGNVYQFFRVETHTVKKSFDYIRQRYAVKHVFLIYLADQPTMYQYPDELGLLNKMSNKDAVLTKLRYYIQESLLNKLYYFNYTGLNTDILRVDIQFNQMYSIPSIPVLWADRNVTGPGAMNPQNYSRRISPYAHAGAAAARIDLQTMQQKARQLNKDLRNNMEKNAQGDPEKYQRYINMQGARAKQEYKDLQDYIVFLNKEIVKRENAFNIQQNEVTKNTINSRQDLFKNLVYAEDVGESQATWDEAYNKLFEMEYPNLIPRMEPDIIGESSDIVKSENEKLMEKIFSIQLAPRDLMNLEMEIIADPYWLGVPNLFVNGKYGFNQIKLPTSNEKQVRELINSRMPLIETDWATKQPTAWSANYGGAQWYAGGQLIYFGTMIPEGGHDDSDMLTFNYNDQIVGIYMVIKVTNVFKDGKWTQKINATRDLTIPAHIIPRANATTGTPSFEEWANAVLNSEDLARDRINKLRTQDVNQRRAELERERLVAQTNEAGTGATGSNIFNTTAATTPGVQDALNEQRRILRDNPPPTVVNPVTNADALVAAGQSRDQAYVAAKKQYSEEINAYYKHIEEIDKKAYAQAGVPNNSPYSAETLSGLAMTKSRGGGLDDWKINNTTNQGPAALNNPLGVGYIAERNKYNAYSSWEQGLKAGNEYYNYGVGVVPGGRNGPNRYLKPSSVPLKDEAEYIRKAALGGKG